LLRIRRYGHSSGEVIPEFLVDLFEQMLQIRGKNNWRLHALLLQKSRPFHTGLQRFPQPTILHEHQDCVVANAQTSPGA
jgi:hypothetical protein